MSTVLVTGGSRGIGRGICVAFARAGYDVAFCYSKDEDGAHETARLIEKEGAGAQVFRCDVSNEKQVREMFANIFGLSVLVNNAGEALFKEIRDTSLADWRRIFAVNTDGAFLCTREAIPKFLNRGDGSIVNISSLWGETGASCEAAYSASKAALIGFTKASAKELAPSDIRVNCISCGIVSTKMNDRLSEKERDEFLKGVPLGREALPEEIAAAALYLAQSRYVTGEILRVNGGALM